jgi:hypothetical protein
MSTSTPEERVESELAIFSREVDAAAQFLYAQMTINLRARANRSVLRALNDTPRFWNTVAGALQLSTFIALGRIFDQDSPHNVDRLLRVCQEHPEVFSKEALAARKRRLSKTADEWLAGYMAKVKEPTALDFRHLRKVVAGYRRIYQAQLSRIRNEVFAHKRVVDPAEVAALFGTARTKDFERVVVGLGELQSALWQLLYNGSKPVPRRRPSSARRLTRQPNYRLDPNRLPDMLIREAKECMEIVRRGADAQRESARETRAREGAAPVQRVALVGKRGGLTWMRVHR